MNGDARKAPWLNATVVGLAAASLFSDMGHEMATAAMPAFLASLGANSAALGAIEGVADGAASFAKLWSGQYTDRLAHRKPLAVAGYFVTAAGMASFALATQTWHVALGRVAGWIGRGARTPVRNVLMVEATSPESRGRAFGFERAMDSAGAILGPLVAVILLAAVGVRSLFLLTLVPSVAAAACIALLVRERPRVARRDAHLLGGWHEAPRPFRRFLAAVFIAGLGDYSNTLLILWAMQAWTPLYGAQRAATMAMGCYILYNVVYTVTCYVSGALADATDKRNLLASGYGLAALPAIALFIPGASILKFGAAFALSGLYMGIWETVESATAAEYLPAEIRGVGFGLLATVNGIGDLVSSVVVGALWLFSPDVAMLYVIATAMLGAVVISLSEARPA